MAEQKLTIPDITARKGGKPLSMLTAYDWAWARIQDQAGIDMILVGDSLGMTMLGYTSTVPVTMDAMVHHTAAVARGAEHALVVADMPFGSLNGEQISIANATRLIQQGGADAVKIEGGVDNADIVRAIVRSGIPVQGHVGLTPQTAVNLGGFKVQGKSAQAARKVFDDAMALQDAGCFSIVLEAVPTPLAREITRRLAIPTIGIGAGNVCDGQVLVMHDLLGLFDRFTPKFVRQYAKLGEAATAAIKSYIDDVGTRAFPAPENSFDMKADELQALLLGLGGRDT